MKLRIQKNTVRIRLNNQEVNRLANGESLSERTDFPSSTLEYKIGISNGKNADLIDGSIIIQLEKAEVERWATTDQVSISIELSTRDDKKISILVEKDIKL